MGEVWALALHGGAGPARGKDYTEAEAHMFALLREGAARLQNADKALDVVHDMVQELEASGHHTAGRGASPNREGRWELDAALMDGPTREAGAVAALRGFKSPIAAARAVMDRTPHVLIVGKGASRIAAEAGLERVWNPQTYYAPAVTRLTAPGELAHGTVGAVALDTAGRLAAATSTGGLLNKTPGRVGDSPILGAGTWADERVAVSCTGQGEYFMRVAAAADVSARVRYGAQSLEHATAGAVEDMGVLGGDGGLIAVDVLGNIAAPYNSEGMKRGLADWRGRFEVKTFA
ncbi:MAG: isoaspartyl peptidase/L-asparaginase [Pseudomonadota bacterium]